MKSLQESLFDDNIKKELRFRDVYDIKSQREAFRVQGAPVLPMFMVNKVCHYKNPLHPDILPDFSAGFLGIIGDLPVPKANEFNNHKHTDWCDNAYNTLRKYIKNVWKKEYDDRCEIYLRSNPDMSSIEVEFDLADGLGITKCIFVRK